MHFNWFFSAKAYFKVCIEAQNNLVAIFPCQSLLLSTIVLNDIGHSMQKLGKPQVHESCQLLRGAE